MSVKHTLRAATDDSAANAKSPFSAGSQKCWQGAAMQPSTFRIRLARFLARRGHKAQEAAHSETGVLVVICSTARAKSCKPGSLCSRRLQGRRDRRHTSHD